MTDGTKVRKYVGRYCFFVRETQISCKKVSWFQEKVVILWFISVVYNNKNK